MTLDAILHLVRSDAELERLVRSLDRTERGPRHERLASIERPEWAGVLKALQDPTTLLLLLEALDPPYVEPDEPDEA